MTMTTYTPLQRHKRRAARLALYGSLALVGGAAFGFSSYVNRPLERNVNESWVDRDYENLPEVLLLQRYVRIDTSEATGDEVAGARFLAEQLEAAGISARIEQVGERKANLYALLEGEDPRPLVLHNHIDVAPADPEEWFSPPFEAKIALPWIYGRGVFDMKSVAIAQLLTMIDLRQSGVPLKRSVLFLATSSEERGSRLGVRRILEQDPEMARSFWAVLTEGGVVEARARDNIKYWGTEFAQKRFADLVVCGGEREPLEGLRQELVEAGYTETELRLTPEVATFFEAYAASRDDWEIRESLENPREVLGDVARFRKLPPYLRSLYRNEAVPFEVEGAPGGGYRMLIKLHLLPGEDPQAARERLLPAWRTFGLTTTFEAPETTVGSSPLDHPVFEAIQATLRESHPGAPVGPYMLPWTATDARFFRAAGVPAYGFSPFLILSTDTLQVDRANERFALPGFVDGVEVYRELVRRLVADR
jgi:acetylornithine deacetylase/succinyl-diaminopimelate desuccinylase-like protein